MRKKIFPFLRSLFAVGALLFLFFLVFNYLFPLHDHIEYSQIILDKKGEVIHSFLTSDEKWRMKTELPEISPTLRKAIIHKEDRFFYYHLGINPVAITRALFMNVIKRKRTSGASTITMQVARMLEPKNRTYGNKLIEMFRALQLEWKYSKDEILQLYLNLVPYGGNIEGVKSASVLYFKKNPDHLSLAEVTALSIIPNRPSSLRIGYNNDAIVKARNEWLQNFSADNLFPKQQITDAMYEPLSAKRTESPKELPHLSWKLHKAYKSDIIRTCIKLQSQKKIEKLTSDYVSSLIGSAIHNAAVIVIDNRSHEIVSYVGSANFFNTTDGGQVNGAGAIRQPGSALKPLMYGLCFDKGLLTPKTVVTDVPININGYQPENFDSRFNGLVSVEFALENSLNIPAVKALNDLGSEELVDKLIGCGFKQVKRDKRKLGLSVILGGCGVTLEEMTTLYSAFSNQGVLYSPKFLSDNTSIDTTRILSSSATFMLTEILSRLARPDLPSNWEQSMHAPRIAWKTGTSYGKRDAWSIGYNKNFTVGIWVGNFSGQGVPELSGANIATPLLFKIFNTVDYNSPNDWYTMPKECNLRSVCSETGKLPNEFCTDFVMDYYIPLVSASKKCDNMKEVCISSDEQLSYCKNCLPENGYKKKWYKVVLPELQSYYDDNRIPYQKIPSHNPSCDKIFVEGKPNITSPLNGAEYLISRTEPEPIQLICETTNDVKTVYWYINNKFYQQSKSKDRIFFSPEDGTTKISCTDDKGRNTNIWIKVKLVNL